MTRGNIMNRRVKTSSRVHEESVDSEHKLNMAKLEARRARRQAIADDRTMRYYGGPEEKSLLQVKHKSELDAMRTYQEREKEEEMKRNAYEGILRREQEKYNLLLDEMAAITLREEQALYLDTNRKLVSQKKDCESFRQITDRHRDYMEVRAPSKFGRNPL